MSVSVVVPILRPNDAELRRFAGAMFRYADDAGFVSLRVFPQAKPGQAPPKPPPGGFEFMAAQIKDGFDHMVTTAAAVCLHAVNPEYPGVFCPPICTFQDREGAKESDILNGVALSVELDTGNPYIARAKLEALLGPVTVALQSGGTWADPATGEIFPRVHLHWRLNEPTRCPDDHGRLRLARKLAAQLVNADMTAVPISHPLRWPGSWNLKGAPVMATICAYNYTAEIDLGTALERLGDAIEAAGMLLDTSPHTPGDLLTTQNFARLRAATLAIPNKTQDWWGFNRMGMALYAATNGDLAGRDIYAEWSATSPKHVEDAVNERWANYAKSPPTRIGAGTIFYEAKTHGWRDAPISVGLAMDERPEPPEPDMRSEMPGHSGHSGQNARTSEFVRPFGNAVFQPPSQTKRRPRAIETVEPIIETADFVEGLLNRRSLAVVYGAPNAGKSFFVSDLAINVALGQPWQDRNIIPGLVIYCALEGTFGINNRIAAFKERSGFDYNGVPFVLLPGGLDLRTSSNDAVYLIELAQQLACEYEMDTALVVIDTVARAMAGGNENASEDMGALIKNLELIAEETGACVLGIHHSGKDETRGARGWSGLRAAIDTEIEVRDAGVLKTATVLKQRDLPKGGQFFFTLEQVTLGQNQWGKDVTSCVVKMAQGMAPINEPKSKNLKGFAKRALEVLKDVIATSGKAGFGCPQNALTVTEDDWRDRFYDTGMVGAAQNVKQKQFKRSSNTLLEQHIVATHAGRVWLVNAKDEPPQPDIPDI